MANHDLSSDPPPTISAAELRRRLLLSTPPPAGSSTSVQIDLDAPATQPMPYSGPTSGIADAASRLRMPGHQGPVAASSLPPVVDSPADAYPLPRRGGGTAVASRLGNMIDPAAVAMAAHTGTSIPSQSEIDPPWPTGTPRTGTLPNVSPPLRPESPSGTSSHDEFRRIKGENRELRKLLEEMKQLLQEASDNEQKSAAREQELQSALAERQRQADELTNQLTAIEEQIASGAIAPAPPVPQTHDELDEWADELKRESSKLSQERKGLEEDRRQLQEDEEALEHQMRAMEVSMARERAQIARQEVELKRLSAEIQHELEIMRRGDASLRERLSKFQRRANDAIQGKPGSG